MATASAPHKTRKRTTIAATIILKWDESETPKNGRGPFCLLCATILGLKWDESETHQKWNRTPFPSSVIRSMRTYIMWAALVRLVRAPLVP